MYSFEPKWNCSMVVLAGVNVWVRLNFYKKKKKTLLGLLNFRCSTVLIISRKGHFTQIPVYFLKTYIRIIDFKIVIFLVLKSYKYKSKSAKIIWCPYDFEVRWLFTYKVATFICNILGTSIYCDLGKLFIN